MEWRDVAMLLLGILLSVVGWIVSNLKSELLNKTNNAEHNETVRRVTDNEKNIGTLYSSIHDEEVERLKSHMDIVVMQNKNQSALLATLASVAARYHDNNHSVEGK